MSKDNWDSSKQQRFVEGKTADASVLNIVGQHAASKLEAHGITKAHQLVGFYMFQDLDDDKFKHWLEHTVGISHKPSLEYYTSTVRKWCTAISVPNAGKCRQYQKIDSLSYQYG